MSSSLIARSRSEGPRTGGPPAFPLLHACGWLLVAVFWPLNWLLDGMRTHALFFPLWLGYTLAVNDVERRWTGSSLLSRSPRTFLLLFVCSIPAWWLFELLNVRTGNWTYLGRDLMTDLEFALWSSLSFSTVMPAVFSTASLWRGARWMRRMERGPRLPLGGVAALAAGAAMLALLLLAPRLFYPFLWVSLFLILDPLCRRLGRPSLLARLRRGDWSAAVALGLGALTCGFFWELWNWASFPKWVYDTPGVDFLHVFEMPLLGYGGYVPFAWELYALAHLLRRRHPGLGV